MGFCRAAPLCLLLIWVINLSSALMLDRLPHRIPLNKESFAENGLDDDDLPDTFDNDIDSNKVLQEPETGKSSWRGLYPLTSQDVKLFGKRAANSHEEVEHTSEKDKEELADILKDDDEDEPDKKKKKTVKKSVARHLKTKRQSNDESDAQQPEQQESEAKEESPKQNESFQDWLRKEYYRNMAKSFASMRRKRDGSGGYPRALPVKRQKKSIQQPTTSITDITDNLRNIEDQLFQDALQVMRDSGDEYEADILKQNRITNDLNLAYDLENMRNAFFRLRETLNNMENEDVPEEEEEGDLYHFTRKRSGVCPPLDQLTSDCSALSDIMPDGPLKRLLRRACNWHEVCYTCGKAYGLTSESCDGSFIEQTQTICRGDAPCESTASLLVVPLRQRRVFYKRSNPEICIEEPCVEAYLREGLAAMEQGLYSIRNNLNSIRHA